MYEVTETTEFIEEKSGGETHKFYLFNQYDHIEVRAQLRKTLRAELLANLNDSGAATDLKLGELEQFDERWRSINEKGRRYEDDAFIDFVNSAESDVAIPEKALRLGNSDNARKIVAGLKLDPQRMLAFKAALTGLELRTRDESPPQETTSPNPAIPPTYPDQAPAGQTYSQPDAK